MKQTKKKGTGISLILAAAILSLIPLSLAWFQFYNPYFYHFRLLKIGMYSWTMLIPVIAQTIISLAGARVPDAGFYVIVYLFHFAIFTLLVYRFFRTKSRIGFSIKTLLVFILYLIASVYYLW